MVSSKLLTTSVLFTLLCTLHAESYTDILSIVDGLGADPVTLCLQKIVNAYFNDESTVGVALTEYDRPMDAIIYDDDLFVEMIAVPLRWTFISLSARDCLNARFYHDHDYSSNLTVLRVDHMILSGSVEELVGFLKRCDVRVLINEFSRFIVALEDESRRSTAPADVRRVLDALWQFDQMNVVVLVLNKSKGVNVYSSFPTTADSNPVLMDTCSNGTFRRNVNLFPNKIGADLQGFKVRFGAVSTPPYFCKTVDGRFIGFEDKIFKVLADHLNYTMAYQVFPQSQRQALMDSVLLGGTDVTIGGVIQKPERLNKFGTTITILRDTVEWFISGDWIPSEIHDLTKGTLLSHMAVYAISAFTMVLIGKLKTEHLEGGSYPPWLVAWSLNFELPSVIRFLSGRQRLLWAFYAFYTVNMNALIKSVVTSTFTQPFYVKSINTIHDLLESDVPLFLASPAKRGTEFPDEKNVDRRRIEERIIKCDYTKRDLCVAQHMENGPLSIAVLKHPMKVYANFLPKRTLRILDKPIAVVQMSSFTRKNYFLLRELRYHMNWFMDVGLIQHWRSEFERDPACDMPLGHWKNVYSAEDTDSTTKRSKQTTITFRSIRSVFIALLVAYGVSFFVFLCEVCFSRPTTGTNGKRRLLERRGSSFEQGKFLP